MFTTNHDLDVGIEVILSLLVGEDGDNQVNKNRQNSWGCEQLQDTEHVHKKAAACEAISPLPSAQVLRITSLDDTSLRLHSCSSFSSSFYSLPPCQPMAFSSLDT